MKKSDLIWSIVVIVTATVFAFVTAFASSTNPGAYKWEDKDKNEIHYTQVPPANADATLIPPPPFLPISEDNGDKSKKTISESQEAKKLDQQYKQQAEETQKAQALQQSEAEAARIKEFNCNQYRKYLANLQSKLNIKILDDQGNTVELTKDQRDAEIKKTEETIKNNCS